MAILSTSLVFHFLLCPQGMGVIKGIRAGKLEYREGVIWGNPYFRLLRSQLEKYIVEELGQDSLSKEKNKTELRKTKSEIRKIKMRLKELEAQKIELEKLMK